MPFCTKCGSPINDDYMFCMQCGEPVKMRHAVLTCKQCGSPVKEGYRFCKMCGAPVNAHGTTESKLPSSDNRTSDVPENEKPISFFANVEEYNRKKDDVINDYKQLIVDNPFAPIEESRQQWDDMFQQINQVCTYAQMNSEVNSDFEDLHKYMVDAKRRRDEYALEIEYEKFKEDYETYRREYDDLEEKYEEIDEEDGLPDTVENVIQQLEGLYNRAELLNNKSRYFIYSVEYYRDYFQKKEDPNIYERFKGIYGDIYTDDVEKLYKDIAYLYCALMVGNIMDCDEKKYTRADKMNYCDKISRVAFRFNEDKFSIIAGISQYTLAECWVKIANDYPKEQANLYCSKADEYRRNAVKYLSVIEGHNKECMMISPSSRSKTHRLEWIINMNWGWAILFELYTEIYKEYDKAHDLVVELLNSQQIYMSTYDKAYSLGEKFLKPALAGFTKDRSGNWTY